MFHKPIVLTILLIALCGCTSHGGSGVSSSQRGSEDTMKAGGDSPSGFEDKISDVNITPHEATRRRMRVLAQWIERYQKSNGSLPKRIEEIVHPDPSDPNFQPPGKWWSDLWKRPFRYTASASSYELRSAGEDGVFGTGDDLTLTGP